MNTTIQIQRGSALIEALATATATVLLKLLTSLRINIALAVVALVSLFSWLITEQHSTVAIFAIVAWVFHLAVMLTIDIAKGGAELLSRLQDNAVPNKWSQVCCRPAPPAPSQGRRAGPGG